VLDTLWQPQKGVVQTKECSINKELTPFLSHKILYLCLIAFPDVGMALRLSEENSQY
jgi:hypothetical protein